MVFDCLCGMCVDFVVFDVGLLDFSGFEVCWWLCMFIDVLVIFLIVWYDEIDWIVGFEIGVDDYVVKLFLLCELVVWVCVILCCFYWMVVLELIFVIVLVDVLVLVVFGFMFDIDGVCVLWFGYVFDFMCYEFGLLVLLVWYLGCIYLCE